MTREICKVCGDINRIGYSVPDELWFKAVPERYHKEVVCLNCFTRFADENLLPWDREITFYPVSFATHIWEKRTGELLESKAGKHDVETITSNATDGSEHLFGRLSEIRATINGDVDVTIKANQITVELSYLRPGENHDGFAKAYIRIDTGDKVLVAQIKKDGHYNIFSRSWNQYDPPATIANIAAKIIISRALEMHYDIENDVLAFLSEEARRELRQTRDDLFSIIEGLEDYANETEWGDRDYDSLTFNIRALGSTFKKEVKNG